MPSPPHEDIPISDKLKDAGVTAFWKVGDAVLQIQLGKRLVSVDVEKKLQNTRDSLLKEAKFIALPDKEIEKLDIALQLDYPQYLTLTEEDKKPKPAHKLLKLAEQQCKKFWNKVLQKLLVRH